jgi:hypothetical protein
LLPVPEQRAHHPADLLGCIDHAVDVSGIGLDEVDVAAEHLETCGNQVGNPFQALAIACASRKFYPGGLAT